MGSGIALVPATSSQLQSEANGDMCSGSSAVGDATTLTAGVPLGAVSSRITMTTDASLSGWGVTLMGRAVNGTWDPSRAEAHINVLELWAVFLALKHFQQFLQGQHVLIKTDNSTAVAYINRQGGTRSPQLHQLAQQIILWSSNQALVSSSDTCAGRFKQGRPSAVMRKPSLRGVDSPSTGGGANLAAARPSRRRSLRLTGKHPVSSVLLPVRRERTSGSERTGILLAQSAALRVSTSQPDLSHPSQSERPGPLVDPCSTTVAIQTLGGRNNQTSGGRAMASPHMPGPHISSTRGDLLSPSRLCGALGLASERWNLNSAGSFRVLELPLLAHFTVVNGGFLRSGAA